jgi:hypothetical protein
MSSRRLLATALLIATGAAEALPAEHHESRSLQKRDYFDDSFKIFNRKRNAHACIMSIVFIVLFPLGAIAQHLPLRGVRVTTRIHLPIQLLGLVMMIGAMGLGIDIADNDLDYFSSGHKTHAHVVIGLLVTSTLILFQPALGIIQHMHYKKYQRKSLFAYAHRWIGRIAIILGWVNSWLGFHLYGLDFVPNHSLVRNFTIMGILGAIWFSLVGFDGVRHHWQKRAKLSAYRLTWRGGIALDKPRGEAPNDQDVKMELVGQEPTQGQEPEQQGSFEPRVGQRV